MKLELSEKQRQQAFRASEHYQYVIDEIQRRIDSVSDVDSVQFDSKDTIKTTVALGLHQALGRELTDLKETL